jgi:LacI family transcriptional regulator
VADHLRELSVRVPQDVALVGYDNWEIVAAATRPALTTIDPCLEQLGRYAAQHLLAMIDGTVVPRGPIRVPCQLIVRDSCGGRPSLQAAERAA